jgi:hypothetical protein
MNQVETIVSSDIKPEPIVNYVEKKIGKTLYRVTNVHKGEIDLSKTLEDIIVRKILMEQNV